MNDVRIKIGSFMLGVPIVGGILIGIIGGLTKIPWGSIDWKVGVGLTGVLYIILAVLFLWSGSKNTQNESQE